jgi:quaternary ammonium compound-resistance protein SugE
MPGNLLKLSKPIMVAFQFASLFKCLLTIRSMALMAWTYLIIAGLFECGWAIGLKYTDGFTRLVPSIFTLAAMYISFWLLSIAMKTIPIGTAYAIWTGIGAIGVALLGMLILGESKNVLKILCLFLIVGGIVGLKLVSK